MSMFRPQPALNAMAPNYYPYPSRPVNQPVQIQQPLQIQQPVKVQQTHVVPVEGRVSVQNTFGQPLTVKMDWQQLQKITKTINDGFDRVVKQLRV